AQILGEHGATVEAVINERFVASLGNRGGMTQNEYDTRQILLALAGAGYIQPHLLPSHQDVNIDEVIVLDTFIHALSARERPPPLAPIGNDPVRWWKEQLSDLPPLALPYDRQVVAVTHARATQNLHVSPELTEALHTLARCEGCTLFQTLFAAWGILLHR